MNPTERFLVAMLRFFALPWPFGVGTLLAWRWPDSEVRPIGWPLSAGRSSPGADAPRA